MKRIIQYLRFSAIVIGTVAFLAGKNSHAQTCDNTVTSYPGTANGVTIDYFGDASFNPPRTSITCNQAAPPISQFYGNGTTLTAGGYTFSSPVNDVVFWVGGMHDTPAYGAEKVVWSTNGGNTSVTSSNYCLGVLSGSTFTSSGSADPSGSNSAGGYFTVHADSPFTRVTLVHTQKSTALNGASVLLCSGSVVPCLASPTLSAVSQPTCTTSTGSFTITNYSSALTYTITPAGATRSGSVVTAPAGTGPYSVTASNGTCTSGAVQSGTVNAKPSTPSSPVLSAVTQPTCTTSTGSFSISNYNSGLTYTISPAGATRSGSVVTAPAGTGPYSVTAANATCSSAPVQSGTVNTQSSAPSAPVLSAVTQPTCTTSTGSFSITNYNSALTYTITPSGATRSGSVVTAPAGTGSYSVTAANATCSSAPVQSGTVNTQPSAPSTPTISTVDPTCTVPTGSIAVIYPVSGATYTLSPGGATSSTGSFTGLAPGSGPYTVTSTIAYCTSANSNSVSIGAAATGCAGSPDLRPYIIATNVDFTSTETDKPLVIQVRNVRSGTDTDGSVALRIYKPTASSTLILTGTSVAEWVVTATATYYELVSNQNIPGLSDHDISLTLTIPASTAIGSYRLRAWLPDLSGGEVLVDNANNEASISIFKN